MSSPSSSEKPTSLSPEAPKAALLVVRPQRVMKELNLLLATLEALPSRVGETMGEDSSRDMGAGGSGPASAQARSQTSARAQAIANLPDPTVMQKQLAEHIEKEVKKLSKQAKRLARTTKPGAAHRMNELYARIRRLNAILSEIFEASVELLKRLFIRVFVDEQSVL